MKLIPHVKSQSADVKQITPLCLWCSRQACKLINCLNYFNSNQPQEVHVSLSPAEDAICHPYKPLDVNLGHWRSPARGATGY